MSVGFGFSAGDFIAALGLVKTVISALEDSGNVSTEYRELLSELRSLETALIAVKRFELDDSQYAEYIALRQVAAQCQRTIDDFWTKVEAYQPHLQWGGVSSHRWRDRWSKIRWAVCEKDDVAKFKTDLIMHTQSIQLLLATLQLYVMCCKPGLLYIPQVYLHGLSTRIEMRNQKQDDRSQTLAGRIQQSYFACMKKLSKCALLICSDIPYG